MVERGKLGMAAQCLERAAALAPQQDYVHRHLAIVRTRISRLTKEELAAAGVDDEEEFFDDSLWAEHLPPEAQQPEQQPKQQQQPAREDPTAEQFIGKDSVFLSHAAVHNHLGNKQQQQTSADALGARLSVNLKGERNLFTLRLKG